MAAFLVRALGEPNPSPGTSGSFTDVSQGAWYEPFVERLVELGIANGFIDGTFRPDQPVTRAEMAALVIRSLGESESANQTRFSDVDPDAWYVGMVERLAELEITLGCDTSPLRFCPAESVARDQMASFVTRAFDLPTEAVPARPSVQGLSLARQVVLSGLDAPLYLDAPAGDPRLFVVERAGRIVVAANGQTSTFLDISQMVRTTGEQGLLGLAFHPDYQSNGLFYIHYSRSSDGAGVIAEYSVSDDPAVADPLSARILMTVTQPASNHNGGMLSFGPDGYLYAGFGDGGGGGDPYKTGQDPSSLLGSIARIDPVTGGPAPGNPFGNEVFYYGLRNPWRFSIDGNRVWIGDVGQGEIEEIDALSVFEGGANLGWSVMEGSSCYNAGSCDPSGTVLPVAEYTHDDGRSITGGYVYRGSEIPALDGHYFYGDFVFGWIRSFRFDGRAPVDAAIWGTLQTPNLVSFGTDGFGELYMVTIQGTVYKVVSS